MLWAAERLLDLKRIKQIELIDLDREILLTTDTTDGAIYKFEAYGFGKKKLEKYFSENNLLNKNNM